MGGMCDWTGISPIRQFAHVRISNRNHTHYGATGTVVRIDTGRRKVWVQLPGGGITSAGNRSIEVLTTRAARSA